MAGNAGGSAGVAIHVDGVIAAFAQQLAGVVFEMANEIAALHAVTCSGSRITSGPPSGPLLGLVNANAIRCGKEQLLQPLLVVEQRL